MKKEFLANYGSPHFFSITFSPQRRWFTIYQMMIFIGNYNVLISFFNGWWVEGNRAVIRCLLPTMQITLLIYNVVPNWINQKSGQQIFLCVTKYRIYKWFLTTFCTFKLEEKVHLFSSSYQMSCDLLSLL